MREARRVTGSSRAPGCRRAVLLGSGRRLRTRAAAPPEEPASLRARAPLASSSASTRRVITREEIRKEKVSNDDDDARERQRLTLVLFRFELHVEFREDVAEVPLLLGAAVAEVVGRQAGGSPVAVGVAVVGALLVVLLVPGVVDVVVGAAHQEGLVAAVVADLAVLPRLEAALERARPNHIVRFIIVRWGRQREKERTTRRGAAASARSRAAASSPDQRASRTRPCAAFDPPSALFVSESRRRRRAIHLSISLLRL
jgi:hypothetical protein